MAARCRAIPFEEYFWSHVKRTEDCWLWTKRGDGSIPKGYYNIRYQGREEGCHRVAYRLMVGDIPEGLFVLHRCDVPPCVRPDHLFLGTQADNMHDAAMKGRSRNAPKRGEAHYKARLKEADILEIRASGEALDPLARRYGVTKQMICRIRHGQAWKHLL